MNNCKNKINVTIKLLIISFLISSTGSYAETSKQINIQTTTTTGKKTQPEKKTKTSTRAKKFIPTEKIQADTSVPFPVDI